MLMTTVIYRDKKRPLHTTPQASYTHVPNEGWRRLTLSLSSVFCDVREAIEIVSGWLLPSPWLSRSSPSLGTQTDFHCLTLLGSFSKAGKGRPSALEK